MQKLSIKGDFLENRWLEISFLKNQTESLEIYPSYILDDGLAHILSTVCLLNKGALESICGIFGEGTNYLIYLQNINNQSVNLKIFEYYDYKGEPTLDQIYTDELVFEAITTLKKLNHQIINLFYSFEQMYGLKRLKELWHHDFPLDKYFELQKLQKNL